MREAASSRAAPAAACSEVGFLGEEEPELLLFCISAHTSITRCFSALSRRVFSSSRSASTQSCSSCCFSACCSWSYCERERAECVIRSCSRVCSFSSIRPHRRFWLCACDSFPTIFLPVLYHSESGSESGLPLPLPWSSRRRDSSSMSALHTSTSLVSLSRLLSHMSMEVRSWLMLYFSSSDRPLFSAPQRGVRSVSSSRASPTSSPSLAIAAASSRSTAGRTALLRRSATSARFSTMSSSSSAASCSMSAFRFNRCAARWS
mmetsp:Transcript_17551/g.39620  ORF Transcript_17551/g.39620 Transcript_17551/m.39620 type:complete len:262 (-) Transcript_17551:651-1436(-)